jgi:acetylornithine deacetylase
VLVEEILSDLVAILSVTNRPNGTIIEYVRGYLSQFHVASSIVAGPEGDRFNLFATIGPIDRAGYILSGHLDVVPADEPIWTTDPFRLVRDGERLIGRGSVDMKGFVACVLASVPTFLKQLLARPIHIALSYDEEIGCVGVRHLVNRLPSLCHSPVGCIVGEPTGMRPVPRHKGKAALRVTVHGRSAPFLAPGPGRQCDLWRGGRHHRRARAGGRACKGGTVQSALRAAVLHDAGGRGERRRRSQHCARPLHPRH